MERIDELKNQLRQKRQEYQNLRNDYEIIKQNVKGNVDAKKELRTEIAVLYKEYSELKNEKGTDGTITGTGTTIPVEEDKAI